MTNPVVRDSFGAEVEVGDYLVFAVKTRYLGSLGIGRVLKINPSGGVSMLAISGFGMSPDEAYESAIKHRAEYRVHYLARHGSLPDYLEEKNDPPRDNYEYKPHKKTLQSASTCYKVPPYAVPVELTQALSKES